MAITTGQLSAIAQRRENAVLAAFIAVVQSVRDQVTIQEIVRALEEGNVDRVIFLLQLDQATYEPLENEILQSFRTGGLTGAQQVGAIPLQNGELAARFNIRAPQSEAWAAAMSSRLVVEIIEPQREVIRDIIRQGLADGRNPRSMALDIVGRVSKATGKREGGYIGLAGNQAQWVANARAELENLDSNYFTRSLRDKRLDSTIRKAIESGEPLQAATIDNAITRMQSRAERYRGETIARTEAIEALRAGQDQSIRQAYEQSDVLDKEVTREWSDSGNDGVTRPTHRRADGQKVQGMDTPFIVGGYRLMRPGDSSLGAPAKELISCRCRQLVRISWSGRARRIEGFG